MKTVLIRRYDVGVGVLIDHLDVSASSDGEWMKAEDVLNQRAIDADKIKTLELQLKEAKGLYTMDQMRDYAEAFHKTRLEAAFVPAGAAINGVILYQRKGKT